MLLLQTRRKAPLVGEKIKRAVIKAMEAADQI